MYNIEWKYTKSRPIQHGPKLRGYCSTIFIVFIVNHLLIARSTHPKASPITPPHPLIITNRPRTLQPLHPSIPSPPFIILPLPLLEPLTTRPHNQVPRISPSIPDIIPQPVRGIHEPYTRNLHGSCLAQRLHRDFVVFEAGP